MEESRSLLRKGQVVGDSVQKTGFCGRSRIGGEAKCETEEHGSYGVAEDDVSGTVDQFKQQDVCDTEVALAEVMWQESDASIWSILAHELETVAECLPAEEEKT